MRTARLSLRQTAAIVLFGCSLLWAGQLPARPAESSVEQLWHEAAAAQQAQQYGRAAALYRKILTLEPDLLEAEVNLGLMYQLSGDLHAALACFQRALAKDATLFAPNLMAGLDQLKLDNPEAARPLLERAVTENPRSAEALTGLANSDLQLHRYAEAEARFHEATELNDGRNADAWYGLGATYFSIEKQAEGALGRMNTPFRDVLLGESYQEQGKQAKAIESFKAAIAAAPAVPCVRSLLGFAYLRAGQTDEAEQTFALDWNRESESGCLLGKLGLAAVLARRGNPDEALRTLEKTAEIDHAFVQRNGGLIANDFAHCGASESMRAVIDSTRDEPPAQPERAESYWASGQYARCGTALAGVASPLSAGQLRIQARCAGQLRQDSNVLRATDALLAVNAQDPEGLYWRAQAAGRMGLDALDRATALNPQSASLHILTGDMLRSKGDLAQAEEEHRKAIALQPSFVAAHLGLARDLNADSNSAAAEEELQAVLSSNPDDAEANYLLGELLLNRDDPTHALPLLLKATHAAAEEQPYVHADLSKIYEVQGNKERAIAELKQALPSDQDGSLNYRLGRLYLSVGQRALATEAFRASEKMHQQTNAAALFEKE
jgi:tetratricopeptide (TPR) repeat protein